MKKFFPVLFLFSIMILNGCSYFSNLTANTEAEESNDIGRYWDFDDILVPSSMTLEKAKSMVFNSEGHRGGLLVFSDRIELNSLVNFFNVNMSKDNWLHKASFKYPNVAMFFAKPDKTCIIHVSESTFSTTVYIWVAPAAGSPRL
jgi:hypothetical protein